MNFYVDSGGEIIGVDAERIFQGSANANTIRFIGAFPSSAQVAVSYRLPLPSGIVTERQLLTFNKNLSGIQNESGTTFNVWEIGLGVKYVNGKYLPDYTVLENAGVVNVQFFITLSNENGEVVKQATARSSFVVERGNAPDIPPAPYDDYEGLLNQILAAVSAMGNNKVNKSGDTMTGSLTVNGLDGANPMRSITLSSETGALEIFELYDETGEAEQIRVFPDIIEYRAYSDYGTDEENLEHYYGYVFPKKSGVIALNVDLADLKNEISTKYAERIVLSINPQNYVLTANLFAPGIPNAISASAVDLPLESMVVNGRFDSTSEKIVLTLQNGNEIEIPVGNLIDGLVSQQTFDNFLATKGQPNGFAGLDANGKVPKEQLPAGSGGDGISAAEFEELLVESLTNPTEEWTDEEKAAACETIGALPLSGGQMTGEIKLAQGDNNGINLGSQGVINSGINTVLGFIYGKYCIGSYNIPTVIRTSEKKLKVQLGVSGNGNFENLATEKYVDDLTAELRVEIYDILDLAGVTETIETTSTYDVRDTAQVGDSTLFVIPDTPTSVTKVEGNSAATDNMLNVYALQDTDYYRVRVEDMGEEIVFTGLITADTQLANIGKFSDLIPTAKIGDILYIYVGPTNAAFPAGKFYVGDGGTSWQANGISPLTVTKEILDGLISVTFTLKKNTGMRVQNFCVAKHTLNRNNWTPFFTGLKSAAFNGITSSSKNLWDDSVNTWTKTSTTSTKTLYKSNWIDIPVGVKNLATSIDGAGIMMEIYGVKVGNTEYTLSGNSTGDSYVHLKNTGYYGEGITAVKLGVSLPTDTNIADIKTQIEIGDEVTEYVPYVSSKLLFPEIENPFGQTIDFENKKITDYGVEIVLTGNENINYYKYNAYNGVMCPGICQAGNKQFADYVSTDSIQTSKGYLNGNMVCGYAGNTIFYWIGILDILGFTTQGTKPTEEEQATAIEKFKAWLTQRYADGNPVTIRYVSSELQSSRDMTAEELANLNFSNDGATYTPIENGIEYQAGNSNAVYGANNTVTQLYDMYRKLGGA